MKPGGRGRWGARGFQALAALLLVLPAAAAFAWGAEGHSIIAEIAQRRLEAPARASVEELLGSGTSLASIASWADDERSREPQTARWHFVDIPLARAEYDAARDCAPDPAHGDCIVRELERLRSELACAPDAAARRDALRYAVHFVGDVHQPLHTVGERKGGNEVAVHGVMHGRTCRHACDVAFDGGNLHALWDTTLIRRTTWDWGSYVARLEEGPLRDPAVRAQAADGGPRAWAEQSHAVAQAVWNERLVSAKGVLGDAYYDAVLPLLDRQLALAGLRLAAFLNSAYGRHEPCAGTAAR